MISAPSLSAWIGIGRLVGDHLWQSTFFTAIAGLLTLAFRNHRAQVRNALWLAASLKFLIPFAALVAIGSRLGWRSAPAPLAPAPLVIDMDTMSQPFSRLAAATPPAVVSHGMAFAIPILLFAIWLCGCSAISADFVDAVAARGGGCSRGLTCAAGPRAGSGSSHGGSHGNDEAGRVGHIG